jgi:hypothetical protein
MTVLALGALVSAAGARDAQAQQQRPTKIAPPNDEGKQFTTSQVTTSDAETSTNLCVAVMDTGLRTTHVDFAGKVLTVRNFTTDDGGNPNVVTDLNGHGTNVAGITVGNGIHVGIAPGAKVIPLKVLSNTGGGSFTWLEQALDWVIQNRTVYNITVVNMSLGAFSNFTSDNFGADPIQQKIATLRANNVAVCVAAGNDFYSFSSFEGMAYPAIFRETVSVGALYDANIGSVFYGSGAAALTTGPRRHTPFSQRLHTSTNSATKTDVFVPGAALTAAGNANDTAESTFHGTSQATPVAAGLCLLAQQYSIKKSGKMPTVDQLEKWLVATSGSTANTIIDGDDEDDNVLHNNKQYVMTDAIEMLTLENKDLIPPPPPASAVTATYIANPPTLTINKNSGITAGANFTVTRSGSKVVISGNTTTINGKSSVSYNISGAFTLNGDLKDGNDSVSLVSLQLNTLGLKLGNGTDKAVLTYCKVTTSQCDGGAGTDSFVSTTSTITTNKNTSFP